MKRQTDRDGEAEGEGREKWRNKGTKGEVEKQRDEGRGGKTKG